MRTRELELADSEKLEAFYKKTLEDPTLDGWFRTSEKWERTSTHQAARHGLMKLQQEELSIRLFNWLRSKSLFSTGYAYLFVLLMLAAASRILVFPSILMAARLSVVGPRIASKLQTIRRDYAENPVELQRRTFDIYRSNNINMSWVFLRIPAEIGILIFVWMTFRQWEFQMTLDGAQFFGVSNLIEPNGGILWAWVALTGVLAAITPQYGSSAAKRLFATTFGISIFALVPWYFDWPAFVLIFLMCVSLTSTAIQLLLVANINR